MESIAKRVPVLGEKVIVWQISVILEEDVGFSPETLSIQST